MRLVELICFSVILTLFSSAFTKLYSQFLLLDMQIEEMKKKSDSLIFISESFCNSCQGKGFASFDEWKAGCGSLWQLESIEWKCVEWRCVDAKAAGYEEGESEDNPLLLYCGSWKGPYGSGEVYGRKAKE